METQTPGPAPPPRPNIATLLDRPLCAVRVRLESLKVKLAVASTLLGVLVVGAAYVTLSRSGRQAAAAQARQRASGVLDFFRGAVAESVAARDRMQIHLLARVLLDNGARAITVTDSDGEELYVSRPGLREEEVYRTRDIESSSGGLIGTTRLDGVDCLHVTGPVHFAGQAVGVVHLWIGKFGLEESIREANANAYPIFLLGFLLLAGVGVVILHTPFRTLRRLTELARRIGDGDLSGRIPVRGHDEVAVFCRVFNGMVERLDRARVEITRKQLETIEGMINTVEAKDPYTQGHCLRVGGIARAILDRFPEIPRQELFFMETAALLHDVGKIGIPDRILFKPGRLSEEEARTIESHVIIGERILQHLDSLKDVARWVRCHHERWDGRGYPDGLSGEEIPFASRVIAVADAIDAMLTDRPYRKGLSRRKAIEILESEKRRQLDPEIVDHAVALLMEDDGGRARTGGDDGVAAHSGAVGGSPGAVAADRVTGVSAG